ncbi:MAG: hypothetical protein NT093_02745 [Candidatus Moranbacteria bacterium]|nr:hypothetical protein [Candidatus Moranbacteria bacterium]
MSIDSGVRVCDPLLEGSPLFVILNWKGQPLGEETPKGGPRFITFVFVSWESAERYRLSSRDEGFRRDGVVSGWYKSLAEIKECLGPRVLKHRFRFIGESGETLTETD